MGETMDTPIKENIIEKRVTTTFLTMTKRMPIEKITISSLCEECGIRRQTFYNHYSDMDNLIETIFDHEGHKIFDDSYTAQTWQEGMYNLMISLKKNKDFVTAVYQGVPREQLETRLFHHLNNLLMKIVDELATGKNITQEQKRSIVEYHQYAFSGIILEWIRFGMKKDPKVIVSNIDMVIHGSINEAIFRYEKLAKKDSLHKVDKK